MAKSNLALAQPEQNVTLPYKTLHFFGDDLSGAFTECIDALTDAIDVMSDIKDLAEQAANADSVHDKWFACQKIIRLAKLSDSHLGNSRDYAHQVQDAFQAEHKGLIESELGWDHA